MTRQTTAQRAMALLELHQPGNPVILPTVWDAWSARLATLKETSRIRRADRG
jgi:2-methylisocitrate lyase-like PEP mutase family enzyme